MPTLVDDFFDYFNNEEVAPICGIEHPRLFGNYCDRDYDHKGNHMDIAGNEWQGKPDYD